MGKTSQQWWTEIKADAVRLNGWLVRQHRGEVTAAARIREFAERFAPDEQTRHVLDVIAGQEAQHASWVAGLLQARGIEPKVEGAEKRYWKETLPDITSFTTGAGVAAHAERMRLERIRTIVADEGSPEDIRLTFRLILRDEVFHESAFREMAGPAAMEATLASHRQGRSVLGLEP
jgi:hypothetical protein